MANQTSRRMLRGWPTLAAAGLLALGAGAATAGLAMAHAGPFAFQARTVSAASGRTQDAPLSDLSSPDASPSADVETQTVVDPTESPEPTETPSATSASAEPSESPESEREHSPAPTATATSSPTSESDDHEGTPAPGASGTPEPGDN